MLDSDQSGHRNVTLKIDLPDGWVDGVMSAYRVGCATSRGLDPDQVDWGD